MKMEGKENDLLQRIAADEHFGVTLEELQGLMKPELFIGCAAMQTEDFLQNTVAPVLARYEGVTAGENEIKV